jgi:hypothetical protein
VGDDEEQHGMHDGPMDGPVDGPAEGAEGGSTETGHPEVDEVLASLDGVSRLSLADQVAVLERAHERLRGALDSGVRADAPGGHRG